jgi:hypothetical protein
LSIIIDYYNNNLDDNDLISIERPLKNNNIESIISNKQLEFLENKFGIIFELISAANYLKLNHIYELCCIKLSNLIINNFDFES